MIFILGATAVSFAQDPGSQDSIIIEDVSVEAGDTVAVMPVYAVTDDPVVFFNLPLVADAPEGGVFPQSITITWDQLELWDEVFSEFVSDDGFLRLLGVWDTGGDDNPPMQTDNQRVHILDLVVSIDPSVPDQWVTIDSATDPVGGEILLGLNDGTTGFAPAFRGGLITIGSPVGIESDLNAAPFQFALDRNFPNPFNPQTTIGFALERDSEISLVVFNLLGQRVRNLAAGYYAAGRHAVTWDGKDNSGAGLPSGVYIYRLAAGVHSAAGKMILMK